MEESLDGLRRENNRLREELAVSRQETEHATDALRRANGIDKFMELNLKLAAQERCKRLEDEIERLRDGECYRTIPDTFIACGEDGNFCSSNCQAKAFLRRVLRAPATADSPWNEIREFLDE